MEFVSVLTLILTIFTLVFYGYMFRHTEHSVGFFLCVELYALIANFLTNSSGFFSISILYLIISLAFLGIGFAINTKQTLTFYTSIGGWCKNLVADLPLFGWRMLSLFVPPAGIVLYFVWYRNPSKPALECGRMAIWGILLWLAVIWLVLGMISGTAAV
jgi:hypothetical protein